MARATGTARRVPGVFSMTHRLLLVALLTVPLGGCYGLWDTNQTLIEFVTGSRVVVTKAQDQKDEAEPKRKRIVIRYKTEEELAQASQEKDKEKEKEKGKTEAKPAPADQQIASAPPREPEVETPPKAVPRPSVKVDASADAPAGNRKPMIELPSPAKSTPAAPTAAERSWQAKMAKRDKKPPAPPAQKDTQTVQSDTQTVRTE